MPWGRKNWVTFIFSLKKNTEILNKIKKRNLFTEVLSWPRLLGWAGDDTNSVLREQGTEEQGKPGGTWPCSDVKKGNRKRKEQLFSYHQIIRLTQSWPAVFIHTLFFRNHISLHFVHCELCLPSHVTGHNLPMRVPVPKLDVCQHRAGDLQIKCLSDNVISVQGLPWAHVTTVTSHVPRP